MKLISLIFLLNVFFILMCHGQQIDTVIYSNPEVKPDFKYDSCSSLKSAVKMYFMDNYKMPHILLDEGYTGSVYVECIIEKDSLLSTIKIIRGIDEPLDKSVIETIKAMPKWIPGTNNGKPVRTRLVFPVSIHWLYGKVDE